MYLQKNFLLISTLLLSIFCFGESNLDSIQSSIRLKSDSEKIETLINFEYNNYLQKPNNSKSACYEALKLAEISQNKEQLAKANYCVARSELTKGNVEIALDKINIALDYFKSQKKHEFHGNALSLKSIALERIGKQEEATKCLRTALQIFEKYNLLKNTPKILINLSSRYTDAKQYAEAYEALLKAKKINKQIQNTTEEFYIELNLGNLFLEQEMYKKALSYLNISREIAIKINLTDALITNLVFIANAYKGLGDYSKSIINLTIARTIADEYNLPYEKLEIYDAFYKTYKIQEDYKNSLKYNELIHHLKDSLYSNERINKIDNLEKKLDVKKKEKALIKNRLKLAEQNIELSESNNKNTFLFIIVSVLLIISTIVLWAFINKRKASKLILIQKKEVEFQKTQLESKNKEITDSIKYAERIQQAILPPEKFIKKHLKNGFVLFKPKDVVSGDFYWMELVGNQIIFAAADCTGHGVPGALVSIVCHNALNRSVREFKCINPAEILDKTRELVIETFDKSDQDVKDGMDISLCSLNFNNNKLLWAGANNPLWILRNNEILETKADKQPIGKYIKSNPYTSHSFNLLPNDIIYIFSDGYIDQFGGEKGKKFKARALKKLLFEIQTLNPSDQKQALLTTIENWRGAIEQVDDICVIGVKIHSS